MNETQKVVDLAVEMALDAGRIQRERYETKIRIESKSAKIDLVTEVDQECEARIIQRIQKERPRDAILAEEGGGVDHADATWRWVIDPLDGTTNYAHGFPRFCVSIGVELEGEREAGVIYDPLLDELYRASRGGGTWLGDRRLHVSTERRLDHALVATGFSYDVHKSADDNFANFGRLLKAARAVRRDGSAALDLCYVAAGRLDSYWEFKLHAWDVAAGILMVDEAGGQTSDLAGAKAPKDGSEIISTNGLLHEEVLALLRETGHRPQAIS